MAFFGLYETIVDDKGEFSIPENLQRQTSAGAEYSVFYSPCEWNNGLLYISYVFDNPDEYCDATFIESGFVTQDQKLKVPSEFQGISFLGKLKGDCEVIGNFNAIELSKVPVERLIGDIEDIKELDITFE